MRHKLIGREEKECHAIGKVPQTRGQGVRKRWKAGREGGAQLRFSHALLIHGCASGYQNVSSVSVFVMCSDPRVEAQGKCLL
jgi:hypothetical protein